MSLATALITEAAPVRGAHDSRYYPWLVVGTVCVGAFLGQLDASIATLVLPTLEEEFQAPIAAVEWVAISYLLVLTALVVPFGRLADMFGRKTMYTLGFLVFIAGSGLSGAAPSLGGLIGFRVLQAVGAAMLQANSVAIITAAVGPRRLGRAIGVQGAAQATGLAIGPSLGGFLISALGWRWVFFIAVPFGLAGTVLGRLLLPQTRFSSASGEEANVARESFDWLGAGLLSAAIGLLLLVLTYGNTWGWTNPVTSGRIVVILALLALFVFVECRVASPLIDFALFRRRIFSAGVGSALTSYAVVFGAFFLLPFYLERILGRTPSQTGLLLTPVPVALGITAILGGAISDRVGSRIPTVSGMLLAAAGLLVLAFHSERSLVESLLIFAALGAGLGLFTSANGSAVMGSAPPHRLGVAGGVLNMTRSLGTSLGVAATGAVLGALLAADAGHAVEGTMDVSVSLLQGAFRSSLLFLAAVAVLSAGISYLRGGARDAAHQPAAAEAAGL